MPIDVSGIVSGGRVGYEHGSSTFYGQPHQGIDILAAAGALIRTPLSGTIVDPVAWGLSKGYGIAAALLTDDRKLVIFGHTANGSTVPVGTRVPAGTPIAVINSTRNLRPGETSNADHTHLEIRQDGNYGRQVEPQQYLRQNMADTPEDVSRNPTRPGGPGAPGTGGPPGGEDKRDAAQRIRDALAALDTQLKALSPENEYQRAALLGIQQDLLTSLAASERSTTPASRDQAAQDLDKAQAAAQRAGVDLRAGELEVAKERVAAEGASATADRASRERIAAGGDATTLAATGAQGQTSRDVAGLQGQTARDVQAAAGASAERIATQRDVLERARLEWEGAQKEIENALASRKFTLDEAIAAATEARERIGLQLQAQQNAIAATQGDITQRGQDLNAGVTQRGQDLEAQTAVRGQDIGRLNQATQSGASLLGAAQGAAGAIGAATGSTANQALARYGPANSAETFNQASAGATDYQLGSTPMPFDPLTIVQTAADAAYAKFAPPGQALLAQGAAPSPGFVAPGAIAAPARVANPYQPLELPPSRFTAPAAQPTA